MIDWPSRVDCGVVAVDVDSAFGVIGFVVEDAVFFDKAFFAVDATAAA